MKTTQKPQSITDNKLIIAFDISKDKLNCYSEYQTSDKSKINCIEDEYCNRTDTIKSKLEHLVKLAEDQGYAGMHVVAEATSFYHRKLFRTAHKLGVTTALVNTESVSKLKVVESNDSGKTDQKDPRIIFTLATLGKTLTHRKISGAYQLLRSWNKIIYDLEKKMINLRCQLHTLISELFCDYSFKKDFLYSISGQAVVYLYGANPYAIVKDDYSEFVKKMKSEVSYIKTRTLQRLYRDAEMSVQHCLSKEYTTLISQQVLTAMDDYNRHQTRKEEARHTVETLYRKLQRENPGMPDPVKGVVTAYWLGRLFGEIGPIADFKTIRRLLRYAGLNIRERSSGKYKGRNKISKKGRVMLRVILSQAIFPLLKKNALFGEYYHGKKNGKMVGAKANTAVQRKFLKMLYGWSKSGTAFDPKRLSTCESAYEEQLKLAA